MRIFITGVAGFIGSNLASKLLLLGHEVIGIDNLSYGFERNIAEFKEHKNFTFISGDISNYSVLRGNKADVIVHLASQKIPRYTNALRTLEENSLMLRNIVQKSIMDKSKLVFASTSDVYGKNPELPFTEESNLVLGQTNVKRWAYALSKIYGEQYIIANHDEYNLQYVITRFFGSYGPNQNLTWWGGPQSVFISKALKKEPIEIHGDGRQTRTFTYVGDTVNALVNCITSEKGNNEVFNVGSVINEEINIADLAKLIWRLINGVNDVPKLEYIPYESFGKYEDVQRRVPDISKLKKYFDFKPSYKLEEGLVKTIEWQRKLLSL
jgi:UDP-glucose 4-epimerase